MDLPQIEAQLHSSDTHDRLGAITALRAFDPEVAVPLLVSRCHDAEFLVRSFVAMGLGRKQTPEGFAVLLELMKVDPDPNVRAEAANSLSLFGRVSASHLVMTFYQDDHWLLRRSILAALSEMESIEELYDVCVCALAGDDIPVSESAVDCLGLLANTPKQADALGQLLTIKSSRHWQLRAHAAIALAQFDTPEASAAIEELTTDSDHRVVGAALERSMS